jgi:hypothetical protein
VLFRSDVEPTGLKACLKLSPIRYDNPDESRPTFPTSLTLSPRVLDIEYLSESDPLVGRPIKDPRVFWV